MSDSYLTILTQSEAQYTESRSRFLAFAHHVEDESEVKALLADYRRRYYDARHVCYAYVLGNEGETTRQNDDGEPSGTAGRPIIGQIRAAGLTYVLVVVVRYFGGVKLGTSRLGVAYKTAAADALAAATTEERIVTARFTLSVPYADADVAMRYVREASANIVQRDYTATDNLLTVEVRLADEEALRSRLSKILTLTLSNK